MKVTFWHSDKPRERILADAFSHGVAVHADTIELRPLQSTIEIADCDVAVMVGVKSRELYRAHWNAGIHTIMLDKGYVRHSSGGPVKVWQYWRAAVDAHHPTGRLLTPMPFDRIERLNIPIVPWRKNGQHILFAGSSAKYHDFYGLRDPTSYAQKIFRQLKALSGRDIIYRPKPSWSDAITIEGSRFAREGQIETWLENAHVLVTHGSNACFEAVVLGVPCIILGDAVAKPISSTSLEDVESPLMVSPSHRWQWLANLAYCQWTLPEFASGEAWSFLRTQIYV